MLYEEAIWIGQQLVSGDLTSPKNVLNVGSSTYRFRSEVQSYIQEEIFSPLAKRGTTVVHLDLKEDAGIDINGDLCDTDFQQSLKARHFDGIICSNLLEHVPVPREICEAIVEIAQPDALIVVTVPRTYPYHKDPIDTMFRPSIEQLAKMFPGTKLVSSAYIKSNMSMWNNMRMNWKFGVLSILRLFGIHKRDWSKYIRYVPSMMKKYEATCVTLRKMKSV